MYEKIKKNQATYIVFPLVDADGDFVSGATITGEYNYWEDGTDVQAAFIALTNAEVEIGATGVYRVLLTAGETNHGYLIFKFTSATSKPQLLEFRTTVGDPLNLSVHTPADIWTAGSRALTTPNDYKATGFSVHSAADVWSEAVKVITGGVLTTPADYKATGFSTHDAADIWIAGSRELSTPANYMADVATALTDIDLDHFIQVSAGVEEPTDGSYLDQIMHKNVSQTFDPTTDSLEAIRDRGDAEWDTAVGFSTHSQADVWTTGSRELSTPANYKATGFSVHAAADIWSVVTRVITGGALTTPADYKATGFSTHNADAVWSVGSRVITGGVLTTPADYKATGFSTHSAANVWGVVTRQLSGTIADFDALDTALDSAHGAGSWLTGGAGGATIQVIPSIPKNIDVSNTKLVRIALYLTDQNDDLPTTAEITPGTITIDRSADGGTSWTNVVNAAACLEHAGCIYYDEVFDSGTGYSSGDMIRITFKGQKVTISANDHEIADATNGMVFITRMDSGLSGGGPSAGDIADAVWDEPIADHTNNLYFGGKNQKYVPSETIADYKATGFSTHGEADVWTTGSRELSTPANYKATGFSTHNAAAIWSVVTRVITGGALTTPNDYKANVSGLSTHTAANVWSVASRVITGGVLTTPNDYKATGFSVHAAADIWGVVTRVITGGVLTTPADYKATGFSTHNEAAVWTTGSRELSTPANYKANVSALALEATVLDIKALTDNLPANTELELIKLKGIGGIWLVAEYHHDGNNDNDYIQFWQYGNQTDFDNETKVNAVNKWRQDITYSSSLPVKSKWDKVA